MPANKYWLKGKAYRLTVEQAQKMAAHYANTLPRDQEDKAIEWIEANGIEPEPEPIDPTILPNRPHPFENLIPDEEKAKRKGKGKKGNDAEILLVLIGSAAVLILDYFVSLPGGEATLATLLGALITGAGVVTTFSARDHVDEYILIGDVDTAMPLSGIQVEVGGKAKINLTGSQPLVSAFAKYMMNIAGTVTGLMLRIATGRQDLTTTYKFTNNGATTPNIFANSDAKMGAAVLDLATVGIQPGSYADFTDFSALFMTSSANVGSIDVDFKDGHRESGLTVTEVDAWLAQTQACETNGRLDAVVTTIDNRPIIGRPIDRVRINVPSGGTLITVAVLKLSAEDWARLKSAA